MSRLNKTDLYSIFEIIKNGANFFEIKDYQRGYRWDTEDIKNLVEDIIGSPDNRIYCLQPLVVTRLAGSNYEIIDGQQRLTSFRLMLKALNKYRDDFDHEFTIIYETRNCQTFWKKILNNEFESLIDELNDLKTESLTDLWNRLDISKEETNRDNFHLFQCYSAFAYLFRGYSDDQVNRFIKKIECDVKFIWYEVDLTVLNVTAEKLFANINKNKIKLTGADLIKALFILDIENSNDTIEAKHYKKQNLANEWDEVEHGLRKSDFWYFITNHQDQHYDVRIGKIFDIYADNRYENEFGAYFTLRKCPSIRKWENIYLRYKVILEWFEDIQVYHRIGFLINMNIKPLKKILDQYLDEKNTKSKSIFYRWLDDTIKDYFKNVRFSEINYNTPKYRGRYGICTGILLFYNILLLEKYYSHQKFSFGDFIEQEWSLEHIQPQKPKEKSVVAWLRWLEDIQEHFKELEDDREEDLIIKVDKDQYAFEAINLKDLFDELNTIKKKLTVPSESLVKLEALQDMLEDEFPVHQIKNLTLLDRNTNSKLQNGSFKEKRSIILKLNQNLDEKDKFYLPLGTLHVFTKTMIVDLQNIQLEYWSQADADSYERDVLNLLQPYLNLEDEPIS